jgi:hypothetical protein
MRAALTTISSLAHHDRERVIPFRAKNNVV